MVELGNYFEPAILKWLGDTLNMKVEHNNIKAMNWSDKTPFMFATLDGWATNDKDYMPVEVKFSQWDDDFDDTKYPDKYEIQMQHQLYCTDSEMMILVACVKNKFAYWYVSRNDALIKRIIALNTEFWERVQNNDPPLAINGDNDILRLIYPDIAKNNVELSAELKKDIELIPDLKRMITAGNKAQKSFDTIKCRVEQELAGNDIATVNGVPMFSVKEVSKKGHTVAPTTYKQIKYLGE